LLTLITNRYKYGGEEMKKKCLAYLLLASVFCWQALVRAGDNPAQAPAAVKPAAGPFACGLFGPNVTNNPKADLGLIATAMFATPGQANYVGFLEQGPWFLIDSYGSGPLMGCRPTTSQWSTDDSPRLNYYDELGMLRQQIVQVPNQQGGTSPVTLKFLYRDTDPLRVAYAEQLCFSAGAGSTALYRLQFTYAMNQLRQVTITEDAACPDYAGTHTYAYGSAAVPNLPTKDDFVDSQGSKSTTLFSYQVSNNLLQKVDFGGGNNLTYGYAGTLLQKLNINSPSQTNTSVISYQPGLQWLSSLAPSFGWGLTMTYVNGNVVSALQDTGCPGSCPPSVFAYFSHPMPGKTIPDQPSCFVATRQQHVAAGRASAVRGYVYAKGSGEFLGSEDLHHVVPLRERSAGKFYVDPSCE
jgi:hypothetical protein